MGTIAYLGILWGACFFFMLATTILAARLGRNREDQLFLADSSNYAKSEQDEISVRLGKIKPLRTASYVILGLATVALVGFFLMDLAHRFGY